MSALTQTVDQLQAIARQTGETFYVRRLLSGRYVASSDPTNPFFGPPLAIVYPDGRIVWTNGQLNA